MASSWRRVFINESFFLSFARLYLFGRAGEIHQNHHKQETQNYLTLKAWYSHFSSTASGKPRSQKIVTTLVYNRKLFFPLTVQRCSVNFWKIVKYPFRNWTIYFLVFKVLLTIQMICKCYVAFCAYVGWNLPVISRKKIKSRFRIWGLSWLKFFLKRIRNASYRGYFKSILWNPGYFLVMP